MDKKPPPTRMLILSQSTRTATRFVPNQQTPSDSRMNIILSFCLSGKLLMYSASRLSIWSFLTGMQTAIRLFKSMMYCLKVAISPFNTSISWINSSFSNSTCFKNLSSSSDVCQDFRNLASSSQMNAAAFSSSRCKTFLAFSIWLMVSLATRNWSSTSTLSSSSALSSKIFESSQSLIVVRVVMILVFSLMVLSLFTLLASISSLSFAISSSFSFLNYSF